MAEQSPQIQEYFDSLNERVLKEYEIANVAKSKGYDPEEFVDIPLAKNMAERVEGLIRVVAPQIVESGVVERITALEEEFGKLDWRVALTISLEIAQQKFCKFKDEHEAMEVGIRAGIAYITIGVVASPLEGFTKLGKYDRKDGGGEYFALYFSGPIRSAGGTASAVSVILSDYVRKKMGYAQYDPTEVEIKRMITEVRDYHERVTNLQYFPSEEELEFLLKHLPVQITGDPSEKFEVSNHKGLDRIETDRIRNGICLVLAEGVAQKAPKLWKQLDKWGKDFDLEQWNFLGEFVDLQKKIKSKQEGVGKQDEGEDNGQKIKPDFTFIKDLVAGRPVLTHPLRTGGFRLRYGRCRNTGLSATAIHPATMYIIEQFIGIGSQLKTERPGKGTAVSSCDTIEGPIIKLKSGDVIMLHTMEEAKQHHKDLEEILFLGDILISYGDFFNRAHPLIPCGFNEEWYQKILESKNTELNEKEISVDKAYDLALSEGIPFHPKYTHHFKDINFKQLSRFLSWLDKGVVQTEPAKIILPLSYDFNEDLQDQDPKRILELLGVEHAVVANEHVVIVGDSAKALYYVFGLVNGSLDLKKVESLKDKPVLEILKELSGMEIKDKSGTFIGARMGRPEKAKMRKLTGSPQSLFPVGKEGGKMRSFQAALEAGKVISQFPKYYCEKCAKDTIYPRCEDCNEKGVRKYFCVKCEAETDSEKCEAVDGETNEEHGENRPHFFWNLQIGNYFKKALKQIDQKQYPELIKGVRGTSNHDHTPEHLAKGILRSSHNLYVNKDGTIRYDMTELPLTHFKPAEIGTPIEKLIELGYTHDIHGSELKEPSQIVEIKPQDVVLPSCPDSVEEGSDIVFYRVANFMDDLFKKLYGMDSYYNLKDKSDLVGHLVVALAPHVSAGTICRIIGFSKTQGFYTHPLLHCAIRRDCLGYDSYVSVEKNGEWRIEKIGKIIEELNPTEKIDHFGTLKKDTVDTSIWSNPGPQKIKEATKHTLTDVLRVTLEDGRKLDMTPNHIVYTKGKIEKRAGALELNDQLMVSLQKNISAKDMDYLFLPDIFQNREDIMINGSLKYLSKFEKMSKHENYVFRDSFPIKFVKEFLLKQGKTFQDLPNDVRISIKRDNILLPLRIPIDKKLLELVGIYIAEGHMRKNDSKKGFYQISIAVTEEENRNFIKEVFRDYFNLKPSEDREDRLTFSSRIVYELFKDHLGLVTGAKSKRIPNKFLNLKKEKIAALLRGYYEGDGSVSITDNRITCDTVSEGLKHDLSFVLSRFGIFTKFYEYEKEPGPKVREFYEKKKRKIPKFKITKIIIPSNYVKKFGSIGFLSNRKNKILNELVKKTPRSMRIDNDENYAYPKVTNIENIGMKESYCFNVMNEHNFFANDVLVHNCDGDEAAIILLMDALVNFSKKYLPSHRGAVQDAPLVITVKIIPSEVDDMVFDMDVAYDYPLELYEAAEKHTPPWDVKIPQLGHVLNTEKQYEGMGFTHDVSDISEGVLCSAYKSIPTMKEKVWGQMEIAEKVRAVDELDVARLVIERHFVRDIKGNLRKFSMQQFRCVECNEKFRRPPLKGSCPKCHGKLLFTIAEGSIVKYLEPSIALAKKYQLPAYLQQTLDLVKQRIESVFGKDDEKQAGLETWFA